MKHCEVSVDFGAGERFEFEFPPTTIDAGTARAWFDREVEGLDIDVASPVGKVLAADRVIGVARGVGARRFANDAAWGRRFAENSVALLGKTVVRVDVANGTLGY